jgi:hypothetical protein
VDQRFRINQSSIIPSETIREGEMPSEYSIKINRRDGAVEITGGDKEWVDAKLKELAIVFRDVPAQPLRTLETNTADRGQPAVGGNEAPERARRGKRGLGRATTRAKKNPELEKLLTSDARRKLEAFVAARRVAFDDNLQAQSAILATFLMDELGQQSIDRHDLYTIYSLMGWQGPANPGAALLNAQQRNGYFTGFSGGKTQLTHTGENFGRFGSVKKSTDDARKSSD